MWMYPDSARPPTAGASTTPINAREACSGPSASRDMLYGVSSRADRCSWVNEGTDSSARWSRTSQTKKPTLVAALEMANATNKSVTP